MDRNIVFHNAEQLYRRLSNKPCNCRTGCDGRAGIYSCKLEIVRRWIVDVERSQKQTMVVSERDADLARLRAELEQARVQLAGCLCAADGTGDADKVNQGDYAWTPALQKTVEPRTALEEAHAQTKDIKADLVELGNDINEMIAEKGRLRAALAEAEAERDEALLNLSKQTEYAEILAEKSHNMEVQRDEARALSGGWRRSATYYKGGFMAMGSAWYEDTLKRAEEAERGQAGVEA